MRDLTDRTAEIEARLASVGPTHADMMELLAENRRLRETIESMSEEMRVQAAQQFMAAHESQTDAG